MVDAVHAVSRVFPDDERFGLTGQIRRAAVSVPSNIAEGYGRKMRGDYVRHLLIANGSLKEVETQLIIAGRQTFVTREGAAPVWALCQEVGKMLNGLVNSLS